MHAHTPPFTQPTGAYDSRRLYEETSAIAAAQDAKLNSGNDALPSILADFRAVVARLEAYAERLRVKRSPAELATEAQRMGLYDDLPPNLAAAVKTPAEPARIATSAELADLRRVLTAERLREYGIGDVEPRHPMQAEADRLAKPEDLL